MSDPQPPVEFVQYLVPPLRAGELTVTATQAVTAPGGEGETFQARQTLYVAGARYALDAAALASAFPPAGSQGEFSNVLPHVLLAHPTLPWQRSPAAQAGGAPGGGAAGDPGGPPEATWLALLVFDELDPPPAPATVTLADLAPAGGRFFPPRDAEPGESATDPVTVVDVPAALFARVAPALADLAWTAHVRQADVSAKPAGDGAPPASAVAVVLASRLPQPGRVTTAHLVSLEGYGPYLPAGDGSPPALPAGTTAVRLVSLHSWTFSAIDLKETFAQYLTRLDMDPAGLALRVEEASGGDPAADAQVADALGMGYVAMDHDLRDGGATVSWYRGPLLPMAATEPPPPTAADSDQLLRYDPGLGMLDASYAVAWELGRLLALHDRAYATALYRWKLTVTQAQAAALEQEVLDAALPPVDTGGSAPARPAAHERLVRALRDVARPAARALASGADGAALADGAAAGAGARRRRLRPPRARLAERLGAAAGTAPSADAPAGTDEAQVVDWLTRLHLLEGVPFGHLVPDPRMLPPESIRFFRADLAWIAALIDGAFSIGQPGAASSVGRGARGELARHVRARLPRLRRMRLAGAAEGAPDEIPLVPLEGPKALSGFLLRSAVVSGWPGLEAHGFSDVAATQPLDIVRYERVAPALALCLFAGVLARVDLREPPEGIHFGVDPADQDGAWQKQLRYADAGPSTPVGSWIPNAEVAVPLRSAPASGVIRMAPLAAAMAPRVWAGPAPASGFTAAEFGLEMVEGVQVVSFQLAGAAP